MYMSSRQPSPGPPRPPMVWSPPLGDGRRWDCSGSASGGPGGTGTAVGALPAHQSALGLQWECICRLGGHWDCSRSALDIPDCAGTAVGAHLTYAICSNPWFSKHSFHKYCNFKVLVILGLQRERFSPCAGRWDCSGNARGAPDRTGTATRTLLASQIAFGMQ